MHTRIKTCYTCVRYARPRPLTAPSRARVHILSHALQAHTRAPNSTLKHYSGDPADGADGADVVLVCDPNYDSLLHLHKRKEYKANKGANGNPAVGSGGPKNNKAVRVATLMLLGHL